MSTLQWFCCIHMYIIIYEYVCGMKSSGCTCIMCVHILLRVYIVRDRYRRNNNINLITGVCYERSLFYFSFSSLIDFFNARRAYDTTVITRRPRVAVLIIERVPRFRCGRERASGAEIIVYHCKISARLVRYYCAPSL